MTEQGELWVALIPWPKKPLLNWLYNQSTPALQEKGHILYLSILKVDYIALENVSLSSFSLFTPPPVNYRKQLPLNSVN